MRLKDNVWNTALLFSLLLFSALTFASDASFFKTEMGELVVAQEDELPPPPPMDEEAPPPDIDLQAPMPSSSSSSSSLSSSSNEPKDEEAAASDKALRFKEPPLVPISDKERATNCKKYEKQFIEYYGHVFFVQGCKKFPLSSEESGAFSRKNKQPRPVDPRVIASLQEGSNYSELNLKKIDCKKFNGNYVTYNLKNYWVEGCKLREIPDSATLQDHKLKNHAIAKPVIVLEESQFVQFKQANPLSSVLDKENLLNGDDTVEVQAMEKACRNLHGRYVSYLDAIYKIRPLKKGKGCWREKQDAAELTRKNNVRLAKMQELNASQSISIPEQDPS